MSQPALARKRSQGGRSYVHPVTGETVPGVTTVTGMKDKSGALVGWAVKETTNYIVEHWDELAGMSKTNKTKLIKGSRFDVKASGTDETAADLGTLVHQAVEDWVHGRPVSLPVEAIGFLDQFKAFHERYQPKWEFIERTVWNRTLGYAGTLDAIGLFGDDQTVRLLVDFKSGNGIYPEYALQLAALAHAEFMIDNDGNEVPLEPMDKQTILHLRPDFWELHSMREEMWERNFETFKALLNVWQWDQDSHLVLGARVRGEAGKEGLLP